MLQGWRVTCESLNDSASPLVSMEEQLLDGPAVVTFSNVIACQLIAAGPVHKVKYKGPGE